MQDKVKKYVETVLFPKICGDGGWVEFVSLNANELTLLFRGECAKCLILNRCTDWIESEIKRDLHKNVKVTALKKKPYFQEI
ncbi:MAG: NifU family protein [Clostridiales bacterium]|nr:NifU family protein [Clostridiales bacterium]